MVGKAQSSEYNGPIVCSGARTPMSMTTRRRFIEGAMAAGVVAAGVPRDATALGAASDNGEHVRLERVVFDERFVRARALAAEARRRSTRTSAIAGSIHALWYHDLSLRWREAQSPVAGMTDHRALFLLEMMAADVGMRVVHRVHHFEVSGTHAPRVFGPLERRAELLSLLQEPDADWVRSAAGIVMTWPKAPTPIASGRSDILRARHQAVDGQTLISWIIC